MKLKELLWTGAIGLYKEHGDPCLLIEHIQSGEPIPDEARAVFVDLLLGKPRKKGRGRSHKLLQEDSRILLEHAIWQAQRYFTKEDKPTGRISELETRETLIARLATAHSRTEEAIAKLINKQGTKDWLGSPRGKK